MPSNSIKWLGTNFPELYEWLVGESPPFFFRIKILDPGNPTSAIQIKIDSTTLTLKVGDVILEEKGLYFVLEKEVY